MGTRADFYIGRGVNAEWIGSRAYDGHPYWYKNRQPVFGATTEKTFRLAVRDMIDDDAECTMTRPEDGWPWPWTNSKTTDYAYAYDDGRVFFSCFGSRWVEYVEPIDNESQDGGFLTDNEIDEEPGAVFPDMSTEKAAPLGSSRQGGMVLVLK